MASALEHYVNNVCAFTASGNYRELIDYLNSSVELLSKNGNILDNVLETLDIQQHTLGVLYILVAKLTNITGSSTNSEQILRLVRDFVSGCNGEHVRLVTPIFGELCHLFTNYIVKNNVAPIQGVRVLVQAVEKIRLSDAHLSSVHADLCQLSLCAKVFNPVLKFLDADITAIFHTEDQNHDAKYFLLYYYYGGLIYAAVKNYERALYFFEVAVSTPALAMSHIMLESYKKYILVSLILHGTVVPIPKYAAPVVTRFIKPLSRFYHELAAAYVTARSEDVRNVIFRHRDAYVRDTNLGLVKQVAASLYKKNIQRLTKTFITLSLVDVANKVHLSGPNEAEKYILDMIKSGEIFATINQKDGMVVFRDDPEKYNSPEMFLSIQNDIKKVMDLNKQVVRMEEEIKLNSQYLRKVAGHQEEEMINAKNTLQPNETFD